jgi:hypothetical protein
VNYLDLGCARCRANLNLTQNERDLVILIFVSYVFRLGEAFYVVTGIAILHMPEDINTHELPIPEKITGTLKFMIHFSQDLSWQCKDCIKAAREGHLKDIMVEVSKVRDKLRQDPRDRAPIGTSMRSAKRVKLSGRSSDMFCTDYTCRALLAGAFTLEIPSTTPTDYAWQSLDRLANTLYGIRKPDPHLGCSCNIQDVMKPGVKKVMSSVRGLDIEALFPE